MVTAALALLGAATLGLVLLYLTQPVYRTFHLSSAAFFQDEPRSNESRLRISLTSLLLSRPFFLQLLVLGILLAALVLALREQGVVGGSRQVGVWLAVDTSGSMTVPDGNGSRLDSARRAADELLARLAAFPPAVDRCVSLYTFDMALEQHAEGINPAQLKPALETLEPRALATDLNLIHQLLLAATAEDQTCPPTYVVVYSDQAAPELALVAAADPTSPVTESPVLIWQQVGASASNVGLSAISRAQGLLPGAGGGLNVEVVRYGEPPPEAALVVSDASGAPGRELWRAPLALDDEQSIRVTAPLSATGRYAVHVEPGGDYAFDDQAVVDYDAGDALRVAWELPDQSLPEALGWQLVAADPQLRVAAYPASVTPGTPTLLVGQQYGASLQGAPINYFVEGHPLLADLNLDVAESLRILGVQRAELRALGNLDPVLYDDANGVWFAASSDGQAAFTPGLPTVGGAENLDAFSTTAFFNALRFLLEVEQAPLLCRLTDPGQPTPGPERCALHQGEGDTVMTGAGLGSIDDISPARAAQVEAALGPWLALVALALLVVERLLGALGGPAWR